jgi:hypothetical protein
MQNDLNKSVLKGVPTNNAVRKAQHKRLRRFGMLSLTFRQYLNVVILVMRG